MEYHKIQIQKIISMVEISSHLDKNYENFDWVTSIIGGLNEIHQKWMVHRDLHQELYSM